MRKSVMLLFLVVSVIILNGCSNQSRTENMTLEETATYEAVKKEIVDIDNLAPGEYRISDIPGKISVSEKYHAYSLDNEYTAEMCASQGVDVDRMKTYLELTKEYSKVNMILVPAEEPIATTNFEILIKVKEKDWEINNLNELNENEYKLTADALVAGFGADYETYKINNIKWVVFDCFISTNQTRYATILNGKMIYVFGQNKTASVTDEQRNDIREIVDSLKFVSE